MGHNWMSSTTIHSRAWHNKRMKWDKYEGCTLFEDFSQEHTLLNIPNTRDYIRKAKADVLYNTHFFVMVGTPNIMLLRKFQPSRFCIVLVVAFRSTGFFDWNGGKQKKGEKKKE